MALDFCRFWGLEFVSEHRGDVMRRILIGLIVLLACGQAFAGPAPGLLRADGNVEDGALTDQLMWVKLNWGDMKFVVDRSKVPDAKAMFDALKATASAGRSVAIWYDPDTATIDREAWLPVFVARKLDAGGKTFVGDEKTPGHALPPTASSIEVAEDALARGMAFMNASQPEKALPLLDRALAEAGLAPQLKVLGLKARASLRENMALEDFPPGEARDRGLIGALDDARAWHKAAPDDAAAAFGVARVLEYLGAYDEAIAIYKDGLLRWPQESARVYRGLEWAYRDMGKLREAAESIDKLGALPGWNDAMPYRYHRGWLYDLMGLPEAAIAEYTEGLKAQPDYAGAFLRRSCSYAAVGRLKDAYDDFKTAKTLEAAFLKGRPVTISMTFDAKRTAEVEKILQKTLAEEPNRKLGGLCEGYWDWGFSARTRSKQLPSP